MVAKLSYLCHLLLNSLISVPARILIFFLLFYSFASTIICWIFFSQSNSRPSQIFKTVLGIPRSWSRVLFWLVSILIVVPERTEVMDKLFKTRTWNSYKNHESKIKKKIAKNNYKYIYVHFFKTNIKRQERFFCPLYKRL